MKIIPLIEVEENRVFWRGTLLRFYYNDEDFYDYLLAQASWEENMMAVNVTENDIKKGAIYGGVIPVNKEDGEFVVTKKGFQHAFGKNLEGWFLIED
jgi:hypothetical protein